MQNLMMSNLTAQNRLVFAHKDDGLFSNIDIALREMYILRYVYCHYRATKTG